MEPICWTTPACCESMNSALQAFKNSGKELHHFNVFKELLAAIDSPGSDIIDLGAGTAIISEYCQGYNYYGSDLPHILEGCAMKLYPKYFYRACDVTTDDISWINNYPITIVNGFIDVMQHPLVILKKLLQSAGQYIILHRQEVSGQKPTQSIIKPSYNTVTWHSIINRADLLALLEEHNYEIAVERPLDFADWENNGSSFLLRQRKSWALYNIDKKLNTLFKGKQNGFFIEAGANDGLRQSNTMFLEFYKNWTGILIEPVKELSEKCRQNRSARTAVLSAALVDDSYNQPFIDIIYTPECHGLMSVINNENAPVRLQAAGEPGIEQKVHAISLNRALDVLGVTAPIDILVLDLEGYELNALKGIDFAKWNIHYLLIEELQESTVISDYLKPWYRQVERWSENDYLYERI